MGHTCFLFQHFHCLCKGSEVEEESNTIGGRSCWYLAVRRLIWTGKASVSLPPWAEDQLGGKFIDTNCRYCLNHFCCVVVTDIARTSLTPSQGSVVVSQVGLHTGTTHVLYHEFCFYPVCYLKPEKLCSEFRVITKLRGSEWEEAYPQTFSSTPLSA